MNEVDPGRRVVARTEQGCLEGLEVGSVVSFLGVPYAKPPIGNLRFALPARPENWEGDRPAVTYGFSAPQEQHYGEIGFAECTRHGPAAEDCLTLNVWTPTIESDAKLPVFVWIHGGAFVDGTGSDSLYAGDRLAQHGVVVVTINYRLGALGFVDFSSWFYEGRPNLGIEDQFAALKWVQANIAAFGGDPDAITVGGESVGGTCAQIALASPRMRGAIRGAISQSGTVYQTVPPTVSSRVADEILKRLPMRERRWEDLLHVPVANLISAQSAVLGEVWSGTSLGQDIAGDFCAQLTPFNPVTDTDLLPRSLETLLTESGGRILVGTNENECGIYRAIAVESWNEQWMLANAERSWRQRHIQPFDIADAYENVSLGPNEDSWERAETDRYFRIPSVVTASAVARGGGSAYMYELRKPSGPYGCCHMLDIPCFFGKADGDLVRILGERESVESSINMVQSPWLDFIEGRAPHLNLGLMKWPAYDEATRSTAVLERTGWRVEEDPHSERTDLWLTNLEAT